MINLAIIRMLRDNLKNSSPSTKDAYMNFLTRLFNENPHALKRDPASGEYSIVSSNLFTKIHTIEWIGKLEELQAYLPNNDKLITSR